MTGSHGWEPLPLSEYDRDAEYVKYGPWGYHAGELGHGALSLLAALAAEGDVPRTPDGVPTWTRDDHNAFMWYSQVENSFWPLTPEPSIPDDFEVPVGVDGADVHALHRKRDRLHAVLPFTEGERLWLLDQEHDELQRESALPEPDPAFMFGPQIIGRSAMILSVGVRHHVEGTELLRKWAAWRRQTDEFADQGSRDAAAEILESIARQVLLPQDFATEFRRLGLVSRDSSA